MPESPTPDLSQIQVEYTCGGQTTKETGQLLGAAAMLLETSRRDPVETPVELRFTPAPGSPAMAAKGIVAAHVEGKGVRVQFTELPEKHRRHLLQLLYPQQPPGAERRTARRASLVTQIRTIVDGETLVGYTRDISTGGLFVETENPPAKGTEVNLRFRLGPDKPIIGARAVVIYALANDGMGLKFVELAPELRQAIEEFVESE